MFVEEQSAFAAEVGEQWLPRPPTRARRDALTGGQGTKSPPFQSRLSSATKSCPIRRAEFREDEHVGVQTHDVIENLRRSTHPSTPA